MGAEIEDSALGWGLSGGARHTSKSSISSSCQVGTDACTDPGRSLGTSDSSDGGALAILARRAKNCLSSVAT